VDNAKTNENSAVLAVERAGKSVLKKEPVIDILHKRLQGKR
jgi:hypothetical protein